MYTSATLQEQISVVTRTHTHLIIPKLCLFSTILKLVLFQVKYTIF